jgi:hypothetical protein
VVPVISFTGPDIINFLPIIFYIVQGTESIIDGEDFGILNTVVTIGICPVIISEREDQ